MNFQTFKSLTAALSLSVLVLAPLQLHAADRSHDHQLARTTVLSCRLTLMKRIFY